MASSGDINLQEMSGIGLNGSGTNNASIASHLSDKPIQDPGGLVTVGQKVLLLILLLYFLQVVIRRS